MIFIYMNLKKIIKEEINDLQWIKDVDFNVPFESAKYGTIYKAKIINERLSDDISENCGLSYFDIDKDYFVWVERELRNVESQDIFCDNQHYEGTEPALHLFFYSSKTGNYIDDLWVTEDVVKLYPTDVIPRYKEGNLVLKESDGLDWIKDVVTAKLAKNENWILVNDVDRESISEGHEIQKYLFDLGYDWGVGYPGGFGTLDSLKDFCIYTIYHYGNEKDDGQIYYQDGCRDAEVRISDKDIKGGRHMIYYWSDLKPKTIKESQELDWLKNIKPTLEDAFEQESLKVGDVLTLSGTLLDCDAIKRKMVNDFKIKIVKLQKVINSSYFIPLQKKYWKHLEYDGIKAIRFYGADGDMKIEDHTRKH